MTQAIYIAASSREILRARQAMDYARSIGLTVPCDWTADIFARAARGLTDADLTPNERQRHALGDLAGIREARVLVALLSPVESEQRWETGYAFARGVPIILSRETCPRVRLFDALAAHECGSDRAAIELAGMIARREEVAV